MNLSLQQPSVAIVDLGIGNLGSVTKMVEHVGARPRILSRPTELDRAHDCLVLPGVGSFQYAASRLVESGWGEEIRASHQSGTPVLGLCLGAQLLGHASEEGDGRGLGLLDFVVNHITPSEGLSVPHMGWNTLEIEKEAPEWVSKMGDTNRFYFAHSFAMAPKTDNLLGSVTYGELRVPALVGQNVVVGAQFHPEKSHAFGISFFTHYFGSI